MTDTIVVFAGNYGQFEYFLARNNLPRSKFIYVTRPDQLMGRRGTYYIKTGEYWLNSVWDKAHELLNVYEMKEINHDK